MSLNFLTSGVETATQVVSSDIVIETYFGLSILSVRHFNDHTQGSMLVGMYSWGPRALLVMPLDACTLACGHQAFCSHLFKRDP